MERTLVILKPSAVRRGLIGKVLTRFEDKGLQIIGMKMVFLSDSVLEVHYVHLKEKPFFKRIKDSMQVSPVVALCLKGVGVVEVVRAMTGPTNGRVAPAGTIRGDYSVSVQENIIHASDSAETAKVEVERFFKEDELFDYPQLMLPNIYANDEY
ncbi:MAG: nucleoside-diphosphate kinase [Dysgonamonadaceae bacterium]|jgi:nucleoside-diphosphate kinase|nr:nucleoside-diphosphate kinase [Dysgonamonadaceae bacterium]